MQGCFLNWPVIKKQLLGDVADLLPHADLVPDSNADPVDGAAIGFVACSIDSRPIAGIDFQRPIAYQEFAVGRLVRIDSWRHSPPPCCCRE